MTIAAAERVLRVLEALSGEPGGVDLGVLSARLGLPVSAMHRLLATLSECGFVSQDGATGAYGLTLKLAQLAFRDLDLRGLPDAGQIVLDALAERTREYCRLAVVEDENLVWIARAQGATAGLRYDPPMGAEIVLHATATGKAWLASLPEADALRIVCARGFRAGGPNALSDVDALRVHLTQTRQRGVALAVEEGEIGTVAMAIAFRAGPAPDAPIAGTLSVAGPLPRMNEDRRGPIADALRDAARDMAEIWPLRRRQMQSPLGLVPKGRPQPESRPGTSA